MHRHLLPLSKILRDNWWWIIYLGLAGLLVWGREPFIDEAWYTFVAQSLAREGVPRDFGWCSESGPLRFLFEPTSVVWLMWNQIGGWNLLWARMLSVLCGVALIITLDRCLVLGKVAPKVRWIVVGLAATNYYFLFATTQVRPEALALLAMGASLYFYLRWQLRPASQFLLLTHGAIVLGILFHWQTLFTALGLWAIMLLVDRQTLRRRDVLAVIAIYVFVALGYLIRVAPFQSEFRSELAWQFGAGGNAGGHLGGLFSLAIKYWQNSELHKLAFAIGLIVSIGFGLYVFYRQSTRPSYLAILTYGISGFISWVLTAGSFNDYHAVWLIAVIVCVGLGSIESHLHFLLRTSLLVTPALLAIFGVGYALQTAVENPRINVYEQDLRAFESEFQLSHSTVWGPRQIMWYFGFDWQNASPPDYLIKDAGSVPATWQLCQTDYVLVKRGVNFALYRLNRQ